MAGYRDRVIKIPFPDLSEDPDNDPIWVIIKNPKLLPPKEIQSFANNDDGAYEQVKDPATGEPVLDGKGRPKVRVVDEDKAQLRMHTIVAHMVVAARAYDASVTGEFDPDTGDPVGEQPRMPPTPWTPEVAANLPLQMTESIVEEFSEAINPQKRDKPAIQKTSSGSPNPSTTEPGAAEPSQPN